MMKNKQVLFTPFAFHANKLNNYYKLSLDQATASASHQDFLSFYMENNLIANHLINFIKRGFPPEVILLSTSYHQRRKYNLKRSAFKQMKGPL